MERRRIRVLERAFRRVSRIPIAFLLLVVVTGMLSQAVLGAHPRFKDAGETLPDDAKVIGTASPHFVQWPAVCGHVRRRSDEYR